MFLIFSPLLGGSVNIVALPAPDCWILRAIEVLHTCTNFLGGFILRSVTRLQQFEAFLWMNGSAGFGVPF